MKRFKKTGAFTVLVLAALFFGTVVSQAVPEAGWITAWVGKGSRRNTTEFSITSGTSIGAANFVPGTNNTNALGTSSLRFSNVYSTLFNVAGPITASAGVGVIQSTAPRTSSTAVATLYATYTIPAGTQFLNTTTNGLCHSTGTVQSSIVITTAPATACS